MAQRLLTPSREGEAQEAGGAQEQELRHRSAARPRRTRRSGRSPSHPGGRARAARCTSAAVSALFPLSWSSYRALTREGEAQEAGGAQEQEVEAP